MTNKKLIISLFLIFFVNLSLRTVDIRAVNTKQTERTEQTSTLETVPETKGKNKKFLKQISIRESNNNYNITSKNGHLGRYQFSRTTLKHIGVHIEDSTFLSSPNIQDKAMMTLLRYNRKVLWNYIVKFDGYIIDGKEITESGILAAAHLVGAGGVMKYFDEGHDRTDGNGISLTRYLFKFSGYDLEL